MKAWFDSLKRLDDAALLDAFDHAATLARPWRELSLLARACGTDAEALAQLPLGRRDALLLEWRARLFGGRFDCETRCPTCRERVEFAVHIDELRSAENGGAEDAIEHSQDGYRLRFRLPNSADVAACARLEATQAERVLLEQCVTSATQGERAVPASALPAPVRDAVMARMSELDPQAEMQMEMVCPQCRASWRSVFDGAEFFLRELATYTARVLQEVHQLAFAYGWREADILAMNPGRRRRYLELLGAA